MMGRIFSPIALSTPYDPATMPDPRKPAERSLEWQEGYRRHLREQRYYRIESILSPIITIAVIALLAWKFPWLGAVFGG